MIVIERCELNLYGLIPVHSIAVDSACGDITGVSLKKKSVCPEI